MSFTCGHCGKLMGGCGDPKCPLLAAVIVTGKPDGLKEQAAADRKTLRELERENTPDLDTVLAEIGHQYRKPKEKK